MPMELKHYGVKGMHWGIRRYQNYDGTLTMLGKENRMYANRARRASKTKFDMDKLYNTMSNKDKELLGDDEHKKEWLTIQEGEYVVKRLMKKVGKTPIAAMDIMTTTKEGHLTVAIMTNPKYRGQNHASELAKKGVEWYDKNKQRFGFISLEWAAYQTNKGSINIAKKVGFKYNKKHSDKDWAVLDYK